MKNKCQMNIGVLLYGCGHHQSAWRMEDSYIEDIGNVSYYQHLAHIAEKGLLDIVFFADNQAFNASDNATLPYSLEDFVEHVIPYNIVNYLEMHISRLHCVSCLALNL